MALGYLNTSKLASNASSALSSLGNFFGGIRSSISAGLDPAKNTASYYSAAPTPAKAAPSAVITPTATPKATVVKPPAQKNNFSSVTPTAPATSGKSPTAPFANASPNPTINPDGSLNRTGQPYVAPSNLNTGNGGSLTVPQVPPALGPTSPDTQQNSQDAGSNTGSMGSLGNISTMFGVPLASSTQYNPDGTKTQAPPTYDNSSISSANDAVNAAKPSYYTDPAQIDSLLQQKLASIQQMYDAQRAQAEHDVANQNKSQISGLYSLGVTNPLSSGVDSVNAASADILNRQKNVINAAQAAEVAQAYNDAYGMKTSAQDKNLSFAQSNRASAQAQAQQTYEDQNTTWQNAWTNINNAVNLWQNNQTISQAQQKQTQATITSLLQNFGAAGLPIDAKGQAALEGAAGFPPGTIAKAVPRIRTLELMGMLHLETAADGSLVNIGIGKNGQPAAEVLVPGGVNGISDKVWSRTNDLASAVQSDEVIKTFPEVQNAWVTAQNGVKARNGIGDIALLFGVANLINPSAPVRMNEFHTIAEAQGTLRDAGVIVTSKMLNGSTLTDQARAEFLKQAQQAYNQQVEKYQQKAQFYTDRAISTGIDPSFVIPDLNGNYSPSTQQQPTSYNTNATNATSAGKTNVSAYGWI